MSSSADGSLAAQDRDWSGTAPAGDRPPQAGTGHTTRLPAELTDRLFAEAKRRETTLTEVLRDLVEAALPAADEEAVQAGAGPDRPRVRHADAGQALGATRRRSRARPTNGWESLTRAERAVAALVADGLIYREVGERLFISRRTVETHVASMFTKLGISNRRELAVLFRRHTGAAGD